MSHDMPDLRKRLDKYLAWTILSLVVLSVTGLYYFPAAQAHNFATYLLGLVVLLTPAAWQVAKNIPHNPLLYWSAILLGYLATSTFWSPRPVAKEFLNSYGDLLLLLSFLIALVVCYRFNKSSLRWIFNSLLLIGVVTAVLSLYRYVDMYGFDTLSTEHRMSAWGGELHNPVVAALAYGILAQIAMGMAISETRPIRAAIYWASLALMIWAVLLTQSRGPLCAILFSLCVVLASRWKNPVYGWLIPIELSLIAISTVTIYFLVKNETGLKSLSATELQKHVDADFIGGIGVGGVPAAKAAYGGSDENSITLLSSGILRLSNPRDATIGAVWPAFRIDPTRKYIIAVTARAAKKTKHGFYLRLEELDSPLHNRPYVSALANKSMTGVIEATRQVHGLENRGLDRTWKTFDVDYYPTPTAKWTSILVLNWHEMGKTPLYLDHLVVYEFDRGLLDRLTHPNFSGISINNFFDSQGIGPRQLIWYSAISETISNHPIVGAGTALARWVRISDGRSFEHAHSIYLSTFRYGGAIGLCLWIILLLTAAYTCHRVPVTQESVTCSLILIFSIVAYALDGNRLLVKVDHVWLAFWLPIGILAALSNSIGPKVEPVP